MSSSSRYYLLALSGITGLLCFLAWPTINLVPAIFVAFVPMFYLEQELQSPGKTGLFYLYLYGALFLFNLLTTWWVWNASEGGAIFMLLANSFLMTLPFMAYRFTRRNLGTRRALAAFILYWLSFEFIHFRWDMSYPWLTLGNVFAGSPNLVQWYEYTGVLGGSLWILIVNCMIFLWLSTVPTTRKAGVIISMTILLPIVWSFVLGYQTGCRAQNKHEIVVVQPNIDPYKKFDTGSEFDQVRKFIALAEGQIKPTTELLVLPETAIVEYVDEDYLERSISINMIKTMIRRHPGLKVLTGASTYRFFEAGQKPTATARLHEGSGLYYDSYNTALYLDSTGILDIYHKSKLVPGTEKMPYPGFFKILGPLAIDLGGISGSLGMDSAARVFGNLSDKKQIHPAPLICYESIYGEYVNSFANMGANIFFVITNDGWWGNTPGYKHHKHYASLRAIENRRYVVRSANTGISCVIDDNGNILYETKWWQEDAFRVEVPTLTYSTFYRRHGDYIGRIAGFLALFLLLSVWVKSRVKEKLI